MKFLNFLTAQYPMDRHLFLIPKLTLRLVGFYPETIYTMPLKCFASFNFLVLLYGIYAEFYYGVHYLPIDAAMGMDALCPVASSVMSAVKMFFIMWYRSEFKRLIQRVRVLTEMHKSQEKHKIKQKYFTAATQLTALVLFFACCTSSAYGVRSVVVNIRRWLSAGDGIYDLPFKMLFPEVLYKMPIFPLTFILVNWHGLITAFSFVGGDGFFLAFCFYFASLLKFLQIDLRQALLEVPVSNSRKNSNASEAETCEKLSKIIERHNEIAQMVSDFTSIMVEITLAHFVTSSIIICSSIVCIMIFSGLGILVYVVYTCAVSSELFLYCVGGTAVVESGQEVAFAAYDGQWQAHSVKVQRMILLLIVRSQRNISIKVPFFPPSLPLFAAILRFTGSLVALANQIL